MGLSEGKPHLPSSPSPPWPSSLCSPDTSSFLSLWSLYRCIYLHCFGRFPGVYLQCGFQAPLATAPFCLRYQFPLLISWGWI